MEKIIRTICTRWKCLKLNIKYKNDMQINPLTKIVIQGGRLCVESGCVLHKNVRLDIVGDLVLEKNVSINTNSRVECGNKIILKEDVLIGPNVYISDRNHEYKNIEVPIAKQGYSIKGSIEIGNDTWIGINACILGNVKIGKHCVIGANTVVTSDIPDYCIVVGNPGKIVKRYDSNAKKWIKEI